MSEKFAKRGMLTVIQMFNKNDVTQNACGGKKDDDEKKNSTDEEDTDDDDKECNSPKENESADDGNKKNSDNIGKLFSSNSGIKYNEDGTIPVDIFRTGVWRHPWYGTVSIDEAYLDSVMKNYEDGIIGRKVTFDYHHEHRMNYGVPVKLRKEQREGIFVKKPFTMLVADVRLTSQGKADTESGQVLNFSSEVSDDYIHNEMMPVVCVDDSGEVVLDNDGNIVEKYIAKRYGPTLLGGAVTNHPFITELNPNGLGGNLDSFKMSIDGGLMVANPHKLNNENIANMCFSADIDIDGKDNQNTSQDELKYEAAIDASIFDDLLNDGCSYVMNNDCIYDASEYKAGDADLPDAAFAIVYESKGKSGKMLKVRKLPHHTKEVTSPTDNSSIDLARLKNALARLNQTDAPAAKVKAAVTHLASHADATYRKKHSTTAENHRMATNSQPGTADVQPPKAPPAEMPKAFSMDDVKTLVQSSVGEALAKQREELDKKYSTEIATLKAHNEAEQVKAYSLEVDSFVGKIADGKATPAFQKVARFGLMGNRGLNLRYFNDEKKEYENITLAQFIEKIAGTADFDNIGTGEATTEVASGGSKKHSAPAADGQKVYSAEDVKAMANDPAKFSAFMNEHKGALNGFKSVAAANKQGGK
jgi:hypothetical protein